MRWLSFFILAYLVLAIQLGLSGFLNVGQVTPNLVLPVAVFVAINARREEALIGAFMLGAMQDLFSQRPLGIYAFSYALAALFVVGTQPAVYRDHPLTHFFVTLGAAALAGALVWFNDWAYPILHRMPQASRPAILPALGGALYTALLAMLMLGALARVKFLFGFRGPRASGGAAGHINVPLRE
jgi:rod shape-determining protein MreD